MAAVRTFPALSTFCVLYPLISLPFLRRWGDKGHTGAQDCFGSSWLFPLARLSERRGTSQFVRCLQLPTHHEPNTGSAHEVESLRRLCIPLLSLLCTPKSISIALRYAGEGRDPLFHFPAFHYRIRWGAFDREPAPWCRQVVRFWGDGLRSSPSIPTPAVPLQPWGGCVPRVLAWALGRPTLPGPQMHPRGVGSRPERACFISPCLLSGGKKTDSGWYGFDSFFFLIL